jgi:hypothetical protein
VLTPFIIALILILPILWNVLTVFYLFQRARKGILSPLRFSLVSNLGLSIVISTMLLLVIASVYEIDIRNIGFVILVFSIHFFIGFPVIYLLAKYLMEKFFPNWSAQIKKTNGR